MFSVGYTASVKEKIEAQALLFQKAELNLVQLLEKETSINKQNIDSIILGEENLSEFSENCETIMCLRKQTNIFIWIISPQKDLSSTRLYLKLGADAVFNDTISFEEITLTIKNAHLRMENQVVREEMSKHVEGLEEYLILDAADQTCTIQTRTGLKEIELTRKEYKLLNYLNQKNGKVCSYKELSEAVWSASEEECHAKLANCIFKIRQKLEESDSQNVYIRTIRAKGYTISYKKNVIGSKAK